VTDDDLELSVAWQQHLGRSDAATAWFESVLERTRRPGRHYHGTRHVRWVIRHVTELADHAEDLGAVVAAGFFHDVVYDPTRTDNERASGQLAGDALAELGWDAGRRRHVVEMIEATAAHDVDGADPDTSVLLAADLAVLAAEPTRYGDYVTAVRREYAHLTDADWRSGRCAVLRGLLGRVHLFAPTLGLHTWEDRARANMTAELAALGG